MSHQLISRSQDLQRLQEDGYDLEIISGYLLIKDVPYVNASRQIQRGVLISTLLLADDTTCQPDTHVMYFSGEYPCYQDGRAIDAISNPQPAQQLVEGVFANFLFSAKPVGGKSYDDYYHKVLTYVGILSGPAQFIDSTMTAKTFPVIHAGEDSVFQYIDSASSRAKIVNVTAKLALSRVAIIGLGGTGAYILDLVSKTPVKEIHLFDGDIFLQHNAFRSPGAASGNELGEKQAKVTYFSNIYSKMHRGIVGHTAYINSDNIDMLRDMDFVFVCMDRPQEKSFIVSKLEEFEKPFIDVGMGVQLTSQNTLIGTLRTTTSTVENRTGKSHISMASADDVDNEYNTNIQIADLNAMNAAFAVIKWKKLFGFYAHDSADKEYSSNFTVFDNYVVNVS